jgi:uncharacterized cupredoxin-like copper-binding protein
MVQRDVSLNPYRSLVKLSALLLIPVVSGILLSGCAKDSAQQTSPDAAQVGKAETEIDVSVSKRDSFSLDLSVLTVPSGKVSFVTTGYDKDQLHELVVTRIDKKAKDLGPSDEAAGMVEEGGIIAELENIKGGSKANMSLFLAPGHYVVMCNKPGHHAGGMFADLDVTA